MKKMLLLCFIVALVFTGHTQQQVATLNHNDNITVYYGIDALISAHNAAVNGDIITLSQGTFNPLIITKAVTIRGTGFVADALCLHPTSIGTNSNISINVPNDTNHHLVLEGLLLRGIEFWQAYNPYFIKCKTQWVSHYGSLSVVNSHFINCIITSSFSVSNMNNTTFLNSVIMSYSCSNIHSNFVNCVVGIDNHQSRLLPIFAINSILWHNTECSYNISNCCASGNENANTSFYSIGCRWSHLYSNMNYCNYFDVSYTPDHHLYNVNGMSTIFKDFDGTYYDACTFELQDDIANSILGDDSTQVGIYGGQYPFDPRVRNPRIIQCNVGQRTTLDGKLSVDIEVTSE